MARLQISEKHKQGTTQTKNARDPFQAARIRTDLLQESLRGADAAATSQSTPHRISLTENFEFDIENCQIDDMECHRPKRSLSPNHVVINGLVIDRRDSLEDHKATLGNITEESDPIPSDLDLTNSSENQDDHTELSKLASFLGSLDETGKTQIVDTLINIYKKEILSSLKQCEETTSPKHYKSLVSRHLGASFIFSVDLRVFHRHQSRWRAPSASTTVRIVPAPNWSTSKKIL